MDTTKKTLVVHDGVTAGGTALATAAQVAAVTKTSLGLDKVNNTSDAEKPVSTPTANALNTKMDKSGGTFTGSIGAPNLVSTGFVQSGPQGVRVTGNESSAGSYVATVARFDPNFGEMVLQGYHQPGVQACARFIVGGREYQFRTDGNAYASGAWSVFSDQRLKTNLVKISSAVAKLGLITGYTYDREDLKNDFSGTPRHAGVIAQDVQSVLPEAVTIDRGDPRGLLSVNPQGLTALLVNAVNELAARVKVLEQALAPA